ncbi:peptidylprolyl isomerase [Mucilaginibacter paludis]|uniref:Periplasmic chaperone PpiD n=1 Tax=Mucilaginibacter paludis DSM 18603 TaxID=714943 RepID=H1YDA6_9SPHI|nr:SurA N-terminal domain-containing protein [Mucilaginibacter paludis]EHQ27132.1 PpiC-type peptidyl-prolyl cis-trans isomerase [Mucilaginibacter paludis DSM 18603]
MGIMGFLRERFGKIVAAIIGLALFAFIATEVVQYGKSYFNGSANDVGEVDGEKIKKDDFDKKVDQNTANFKQQSGQGAINPQITSYIQETTWSQTVSQLILQKEIDKLGLVVGVDETKDMISGPTPNQLILQNFGNQQTGQFDRSALNEFLGRLRVAKADDPIKATWANFVTQMIEGKKIEKYITLVKNGLYVNSLDAKDDYEAKNKLVNFKYVALDYASIPDNKITLTDDDYKSYYDEHKKQFKNQQELRSLAYVAFDASPSKDDSAAVKEQITKLIPEFKAATDDSLFVAVNAESKTPLIYQKKGQLDPQIDSLMLNASKGFTYGPYFSNGYYKVAKLVDSRFSPDSVKARHILISIQAEGSPEKAVAKADSLKKLIQSGKKTFAELAPLNSIDKGSAVKGGDLGTFARGSMIPVFEDAVFNGKKGDIKIVTSQYGVHLIEILDQKGSSKVVKVAVVDKPLEPSSKTKSAAYSKAQAFLGSLNKNNFDEEVKKAGLTKKTAEDLNGLASSAPGLDNIRDLVRWAFKADKGDFTDQVYEPGNEYVIAQLTEIKPKGVLSLEAVKKQIQPAVLNIAKAKQLAPKLQAATNGSSTIDQVAQKSNTQVTPVQNIVFANPIVPGAGQENKLIGAIFGSQPNKVSKVIEGDRGVYVYVVDSFLNPAPLNNALRQKEQIGQILLQRAEGGILEALKNKANVKDYRAKVL